MRKVVVECNVYNIEELNKESLEVALEEVCDTMQRDYYSTEFQLFLQSVEEFLENFKLRTIDYNLGIFDINYIENNSYEYRRINDKKTIDKHVITLNNMIKETEEDKFILTGNYTDGFLFDYFRDNKVKQVSYSDIHKHLKRVVEYALDSFIIVLKKDILNTQNVIDYANYNELEFLSSGEIFYN